MSNDKPKSEVNTKVLKPVEKTEKKEEAPKPVTSIAKRFQIDGQKGATSKEALAQTMLDNLNKVGVTKTKAGNPLTKEICLRQINAMCGDIKKRRGVEHKAWWSTFEVVDEENKFQIKLRPVETKA
jgi:hypothetical protein